MNLVRQGMINEIYKLQGKRRILIAMVLPTILILGSFVYMHVNRSSADHVFHRESQIRHELEQDQTAYSSVEPSLRASLHNQIQFMQYEVSNHVTQGLPNSPFLSNVSSFTISIIWPLIVIILGGDMISAEVSDGTMKSMLLRPLGRSRIYLSKFLTILLLCISIEIFLDILAYLGLVTFGHWNPFSGSVMLGYSLIGGLINVTALYTAPVWIMSIVALLLTIISMSSMISLVLMISTLLRNPAMATATSLLLILGSSILNLFVQLPLLNFLPMNNYDLVSILQGGMPTTFSQALFLLIAWTLGTGAIGYFYFTRRDFSL